MIEIHRIGSRGGWYYKKGILQKYNNIEEDGCISIEDGIEIIPDFAFNKCNNLKEVIIPDSVRIIRQWAFSDCKNLKYVKLGKGVKKIGTAFFCCENLEQIEIPDSVEDICSWAFADCPKLPNEVWLKVFKMHPDVIIDGMPKRIRKDFIEKNKKELYEIMSKLGDSEENRDVAKTIRMILKEKKSYHTLLQYSFNLAPHEKK